MKSPCCAAWSSCLFPGEDEMGKMIWNEKFIWALVLI